MREVYLCSDCRFRNSMRDADDHRRCSATGAAVLAQAREICGGRLFERRPSPMSLIESREGTEDKNHPRRAGK